MECCWASVGLSGQDNINKFGGGIKDTMHTNLQRALAVALAAGVTIPPSVLAGDASGSIEPGGAPAKPTLVELIRQKSPIPQAEIVRPVATPLSVPLLAAIPPLRVAEPIEWESIARDDQGLTEPVTLEDSPRVFAAELLSPGLYPLEGRVLGDGLAVDPL